MKKLLLSLAAVIVGASAAFADATIVIKDQAIFNGGEATISPLPNDGVWTNGDFTFDAKKSEGGTAPAYNRAGDLRLYAKNTFTVTATNDMTKMVFTISTAGLKRLTSVTANVGTIEEISAVSADDKEGDVLVTWTGSAKSVVLTVGEKSIYGTDGETKAGQFDFTQIAITGGGETGTQGGGEPEEPNYEKVNDMKSGYAVVFVAGGKYNTLFDKNYGYMSVTDLPAGTTTEFYGDEAAALTFKAVEGGYNITTTSGRVLGAKEAYKTFDTTDDSKDNRVWTITFDAEGVATITNVATGRIVMQDPAYGSFGCYTAEEAAAVEGDAYVKPNIFKLLTSIPEPITVDFSDINAFLGAHDSFNFSRFTNALTAVYQNGRYLYVKDDTGVLLIYGDLKNGEDAIKYKNGDKIPAGVTGRYMLYQGLPQLSSPDAATFLPGEAGEAVAPVKVDLADVTGAMGNTLILLEDVTIEPVKNEDGTDKANNYTLSQGSDDILLYNQFWDAQKYDAVTVTAGEHKDVKAIVTQYSGNVQLYPVEVTDHSTGISSVAVDNNAPVEYFNLQGIRVENPENGLYIRRQGDNVTKVYVK